MVTLSIRLYRLFLYVYPKPFRREYGPHMLQVFRDLSIRAHHRLGPSGMLSLWALTLVDLLRSLVEEHLQRETFMSKNTLIRLGGWTMVVGGAATTLGLGGFLIVAWLGFPAVRSGALEAVILTTMAYGPLAAAIGLFGLRARFGDEVGKLGSNALLLGAIGGTVLIVVGIIREMPASSDGGFGFYGNGMLVTFAALALYGVLALQRKPQPRWNGLAVLAGVSFLFLLGAPVIGAALVAGPSSEVVPTIQFLAQVLLAVVLGVALGMLGYLVQSDLQEKTSAEPARA